MAYNTIGQVRAIIPPTVTDDSSKGFAIGSEWVDYIAQITYKCYDATVGAAVWLALGGVAGVTALDPLQIVVFLDGIAEYAAGTGWA